MDSARSVHLTRSVRLSVRVVGGLRERESAFWSVVRKVLARTERVLRASVWAVLRKARLLERMFIWRGNEINRG